MFDESAKYQKQKSTTTKLTPFVKWAGGKSALIPEIKKLLPDTINIYREPFLGGGSVFLSIYENYQNSIEYILSDKNFHLVNAWNVVKKYPRSLICHLKTMEENHNKEYYYYIRNINYEILPCETNQILRAARFIYLNKTCFNGLYRENSKGFYNVPMGDYKNPKICDESKILRLSHILKNIDIVHCGFNYKCDDIREGDFFYFDPPYVTASKTSNFVNYTSDGFTLDDHRRLAEYLDHIDDKGGKFILSNADLDFTRELYLKFNVKSVEAKRSINSNGGKRGKVKELLVTNY